MIAVGWSSMQKSEKPHPPLGQTVKQPAIEDYLDFEHIVAPLASFDTIDLGDDDLTPTETVKPIYCHDTKAASCSEPVANNVPCTGPVPRPSDLSSLTPALPRPVNSDPQDQDLTPTEEYPTHKQAGRFNNPHNQSTAGVDDNSFSQSNVADVLSGKATIENSPKSRGSTDDSVNVSTAPMSTVNQKSAKSTATEKGKHPKHVKRGSSSSSSEWSDEETGKASSGVSWSRRVHIYGKINNSPAPSSPGLSLPPPPKDTSPKDGGTETVEIIDLSKASASKKKAYLKKLQRLQVKTNPIERPRSTTPINVVTLDEYVHYSSPEASPSADKIKIKLPDEEFSPRNAERDTLCFNFNEENLFSHTKSGILMTNDVQAPAQPQSPRRVLIPPSLTPTTSPNRSAASSPRSPRYIYCPSTNTHFQYPGETPENQGSVSGLVSANWVRFDDQPGASKTPRTLANPKAASHNGQQGGRRPSGTIPKDTDEVLEVQVLEDEYSKRDCSIKILPEEKASSPPVLESKVPDLPTAIASALNTVDNGSDCETMTPVDQEEKKKHIEN